MNYHTCDCGESEYWESGMPIFQCMGCKKCKTSYKKKDNVRLPLVDHEWKLLYNSSTGKAYKICKHCYHVDEESYAASQIPKDERRKRQFP